MICAAQFHGITVFGCQILPPDFFIIMLWTIVIASFNYLLVERNVPRIVKKLITYFLLPIVFWLLCPNADIQAYISVPVLLLAVSCLPLHPSGILGGSPLECLRLVCLMLALHRLAFLVFFRV